MTNSITSKLLSSNATSGKNIGGKINSLIDTANMFNGIKNGKTAGERVTGIIKLLAGGEK